MTKHVDHLLVAYVAGQVTPRQAAKVNLHTAVCPACREELAQHQQIAADLRLTLGQNPFPREADIQRWWLSIDLTPAAAVNRPSLPNVLPVLLSLALVLVFVVTGLNLDMAAATPDSSFSPVLDTTLEPQHLIVSESTTTSSGAQVIAQAADHHMMVVTPVPSVTPMPVPSAPPSP